MFSLKIARSSCLLIQFFCFNLDHCSYFHKEKQKKKMKIKIKNRWIGRQKETKERQMCLTMRIIRYSNHLSVLVLFVTLRCFVFCCSAYVIRSFSSLLILLLVFYITLSSFCCESLSSCDFAIIIWYILNISNSC